MKMKNCKLSWVSQLGSQVLTAAMLLSRSWNSTWAGLYCEKMMKTNQSFSTWSNWFVLVCTGTYHFVKLRQQYVHVCTMLFWYEQVCSSMYQFVLICICIYLLVQEINNYVLILVPSGTKHFPWTLYTWMDQYEGFVLSGSAWYRPVQVYRIQGKCLVPLGTEIDRN